MLKSSVRHLRRQREFGCDMVQSISMAGVQSPTHFDRAGDSVSPDEQVAQLDAEVRRRQRVLQTRMAELEAADQHIANLEQKLLKLKEYRSTIKQLNEERRALRSSAEHRIGQVLLAPYRLPQRLIRGVYRRWFSEKSAKHSEYQNWFERHRASDADIARFHRELSAFRYQPCVSIVTPVFNTPVSWLREAIDSVRRQVYGKWELILVDDASSDANLVATLNDIASSDERIVITRLKQRGGISAASNRGLELAGGDFVGFLDHDDLLERMRFFSTSNYCSSIRTPI